MVHTSGTSPVCLVIWSVWSIWLVSCNQTNKPGRPNRPNEQDRLADFFNSLLGNQGEKEGRQELCSQ